jgi:apolipoprotein N-acyltransferase
LEFQLPIIRSTNTGISSVIYPDGSESKRLGINEEGILDVHVPVGSGAASPYQKGGILNFLFFYAGLFLVIRWKEKK